MAKQAVYLDTHKPARVYRDAASRVDAVKLLPGEYYLTSRDVMLVSVLGAGVAVCLRDPATGVGGMMHVLTPKHQSIDLSRGASHGQLRRDCDGMVAGAIRRMLAGLARSATRRNRLQARVYGGAEPHPDEVEPGFMPGIGWRSADLVLAALHQEEIPVIGKDVGGHQARKVWFRPQNGRLRLECLESLPNATLLKRELKLLSHWRYPEAYSADEAPVSERDQACACV